MKKSFIIFVLFICALISFQEILAQQQVVNGKKRSSLYTSENGLFSGTAGGVLSVKYHDSKYDSSSIQFNELRMFGGLKFNFFEIKTDVSLKNDETKSNLDINQLHGQINAKFFPISIRFGKFRTAAAMSIPYEYETYSANGFAVGEPFFGLYGGGLQIETQVQKNVKFLFDITNLAYPLGSKPFYGNLKPKNFQTSGLLSVDIINYDLTMQSSFEYSNERLRWGVGFDLYKEKSGPFFLDADMFFGEELFSYRATCGLKFKNFDWHVQAENGLESPTGKRSFITTGLSFNFDAGDIVNNKMIFDYRTPLGEDIKDWAVFGCIRISFN